MQGWVIAMWWNLLCDLFVLGCAWKNGSLWLVGNMCSNWQLLKQAFVGSLCLGSFILCSLWHVAFAVVDLMWCPCVCSQVDCHKQLCRGGTFPTRSSSLILIPFFSPSPSLFYFFPSSVLPLFLFPFLPFLLSQSSRRNEPVSRPHSWHSTKFNEGQLETSKAQSTPSPVWQTRYDARWLMALWCNLQF